MVIFDEKHQPRLIVLAACMLVGTAVARPDSEKNRYVYVRSYVRTYVRIGIDDWYDELNNRWTLRP